MNVSSSYSNSQTSATQGQHRVHHKKHTEADSTSQLPQLLDDSAKSSSGSKRTNPLDSLVSSGAITSDQEQAIKDAFESARMAFQTQSGAANASTAAKDPLDSLVTAGTITKDQQSAIKSAFESDRKTHKMPPPPPPQSDGTDPMPKTLDSLVTAGKITSDQEKSIISAFETAMKAFQAKSAYQDKYSNSVKVDTVSGVTRTRM
jgi:hypothetical protein